MYPFWELKHLPSLLCPDPWLLSLVNTVRRTTRLTETFLFPAFTVIFYWFMILRGAALWRHAGGGVRRPLCVKSSPVSCASADQWREPQTAGSKRIFSRKRGQEKRKQACLKVYLPRPPLWPEIAIFCWLIMMLGNYDYL